jgi:Protein of unknown function (DUF3074)
MAALHSALQALSPLNFSDVPTNPDELDAYISDLFIKSELILESVPIPPEDASTRPRSATATSVASTSSEMSSSSARSLPPSSEHAALQKEWGKPIKISGKDNPLNISVYKCSGKDGRGAWFARRSVHEGLGFARFKRGLEREFPESMKVQGAPGEGNIRGIGGEKRVEDITVDGKGRVEVYYLSAQFPGPTAPRDFVTFLVTSSKAAKDSHRSVIPELAPRHYMIISKPCNHPECPPRDGLVRGQYESVEFIREIPRPVKKTMSSHDMQHFKKDRSGRHSPNLEQEALMRRVGRKLDTAPYLHENKSADDLPPHGNLNGGTVRHVSRSPSGRVRGATVGLPEGHSEGRRHLIYDDYDPEANPVEWIMITRSDPGGGIPRFMVERGTPGSIVADAYKFLNWATQQDMPVAQTTSQQPDFPTDRRASFESWRANGTLAGIREQEPVDDKEESPPASTEKNSQEIEPPAQNGLLANVTGALSSTINAYAPQVVLDRLNGASTPKPATSPFPYISADAGGEDRDDASSTISSTSFASADSHLGDTDESPSISSDLTSPSKERSDKPAISAHDKELLKLAERRAALDKKLASSREKLIKDNENQSAKEREALKKAEEKHDKELKKQEEKYKKEVARLEAKKEKEAKKIEERKKRQVDKDEKARLMRERDEARQELEMLKKEREIWQKQVGDLQKENTKLTARVGKLEGIDPNPVKGIIDDEKGGRSRSPTTASLQWGRSRSASLRKVTPPLSPMI